MLNALITTRRWCPSSDEARDQKFLHSRNFPPQGAGLLTEGDGRADVIRLGLPGVYKYCCQIGHVAGLLTVGEIFANAFNPSQRSHSEVSPMMGHKSVEPKLYMSFSLDAAVPANHLVRRLVAVVDVDFVRGLVRREYSHTGQPCVDPIVLFKLWLLGYLFNITSERRLCEEASVNLAWRWFVGYELDEPLPNHSVLSKARKRFGVRDYEKFFQHIVRLCESAGVVEGDVSLH